MAQSWNRSRTSSARIGYSSFGLCPRNFQLTFLRWVGANNDPDVFEFVFSSKTISTRWSQIADTTGNPRLDALTDQIRVKWTAISGSFSAVKYKKSLPMTCRSAAMVYRCGSVHRRELGDLQLSPTATTTF